MVDKDNMSVEEMLAFCRNSDGEGGASAGAAEEPAAEPTTESEAPAPVAKSTKPPGEMSVEEMLAAARGEKSATSPAAETPAPTKSAAPAAKSTKPPGEMSVEEMLAAARGEKVGGAEAGDEEEAEAPAATGGGTVDAKAARAMSVEEMLAAARGGGPKAAPKAKPKAAAKAKPAAKAAKPAKPEPSGPKDTGSIFGDRNPNKPGPVSKSEAASDGKGKGKAKTAKPAKVAPVMPERPAYVTPAEPAAADADTDRRSFFSAMTGVVLGSSMAIGFASLAVTNLLWTLGLAKFMFPNILIEPPTKFKVGFPSEYAPGQVQTKYKAQFGVWVVRFEYDGAPEIYALKSVCTHLGCTPNWLEGEQKFKCPCHGSGFYKDGVNFEGPAPRPLERYAIRVADDGQLEVDKSQTFNEEKGQWSDSASYVKA